MTNAEMKEFKGFVKDTLIGEYHMNGYVIKNTSVPNLFPLRSMHFQFIMLAISLLYYASGGHAAFVFVFPHDPRSSLAFDLLSRASGYAKQTQNKTKQFHRTSAYIR